MKIKISYKHLDSSDSIREATERKSQRIARFFKGDVTLSWNFTVEKQNHIAHAHLVGEHVDFFAESTTENLYDSIENVVLHLERQVKKNKEQIKNRKGLQSIRELQAG